jgi:DNA-binding Lrp family transcriptional regulator
MAVETAIGEVDVYVFLSEAGEKVMHRLEHIPGVRFVAATTGPYAAFAVATIPSYDGIETFLHRLQGLDPDVAVALKPSVIVRSVLPRVLAFIQLWVKRGQAEAVLNGAERGLGGSLKGGALVAGSYDVLLEVGGATVADVQADVLTAIQQLAGVRRSVTSFAFVRVHRHLHGEEEEE